MNNSDSRHSSSGKRKSSSTKTTRKSSENDKNQKIGSKDIIIPDVIVIKNNSID